MRHHQRVDLRKNGILGPENGKKITNNFSDLFWIRSDDVSDDEIRERDKGRVNIDAAECLRPFLCEGLNFYAAFAGKEDQRHFFCTVDGDAQIIFMRDFKGLFDQDLFDGKSLDGLCKQIAGDA